jgi:hypothetical protein
VASKNPSQRDGPVGSWYHPIYPRKRTTRLRVRPNPCYATPGPGRGLAYTLASANGGFRPSLLSRRRRCFGRRLGSDLRTVIPCPLTPAQDSLAGLSPPYCLRPRFCLRLCRQCRGGRVACQTVLRKVVYWPGAGCSTAGAGAPSAGGGGTCASVVGVGGPSSHGVMTTMPTRNKAAATKTSKSKIDETAVPSGSSRQL